MPELLVNNIDHLKTIVADFVDIVANHKCVAMKGEMGVGKTTFIKELCAKMGVIDVVSSPTFSIVNEYFSESQGVIFHFDFYRIESEQEIYDIGFEEYLNQDAIILMEWPEKIPNLLPEDTLLINIVENPNGTRILKW